jgi:hypothetical protein
MTLKPTIDSILLINTSYMLWHVFARLLVSDTGYTWLSMLVGFMSIPLGIAGVVCMLCGLALFLEAIFCTPSRKLKCIKSVSRLFPPS